MSEHIKTEDTYEAGYEQGQKDYESWLLKTAQDEWCDADYELLVELLDSEEKKQ
jgi:hypothetical protein